MGILLSTSRTTLNLLLPFTNASTPLLQDLVHTAILILTLYYGPHLAEYYNHTLHAPAPQTEHDPIPTDPPDPPDTLDDLPIDENLVLQDDSDSDPEPPPLAPTPPPGPAGLAQPPPPPVAWPAFAAANPDPDPFIGAAPAPERERERERPRPTPANRTIGAKKAKSLARKDQRRAYHEFHRQEAELRRLREAEGREEREAALAAEKARRAGIERNIAGRERAERDRKKEEERREAEEERARRERVVLRVREGLERGGAVDLTAAAWEEGKDRLWVERLVKASGILSQGAKEGAHTLITAGGWVVRIDAQLMEEAYKDAVSYGDSNGGRISFKEFGAILEKAVRARVEAC